MAFWFLEEAAKKSNNYRLGIKREKMVLFTAFFGFACTPQAHAHVPSILSSWLDVLGYRKAHFSWIKFVSSWIGYVTISRASSYRRPRDVTGRIDNQLFYPATQTIITLSHAGMNGGPGCEWRGNLRHNHFPWQLLFWQRLSWRRLWKQTQRAYLNESWRRCQK